LANSKLVYSTEDIISDDIYDPSVTERVSPRDQRVRLHLDRKKGGRVISIVKGLIENDEVLKILMRELKKRCATGGSLKNGEIIIQGNQRDMIKEILLKKGYSVKLSGG